MNHLGMPLIKGNHQLDGFSWVIPSFPAEHQQVIHGCRLDTFQGPSWLACQRRSPFSPLANQVEDAKAKLPQHPANSFFPCFFSQKCPTICWLVDRSSSDRHCGPSIRAVQCTAGFAWFIGVSPCAAMQRDGLTFAHLDCI